MGQVELARVQFYPPERLSPSHDSSQFECGEPALDIWLKRRALQNEDSGASRTYVVRAGEQIAGYYALATGAIAHAGATGRVKRNIPDPVPVIIVGRLAIASRFQGHGIGKALLRDAVLRTLRAAEIAGIRAILVHAISEPAKSFYEKYGFVQSPVDPMTLMVNVTEAARIFTGK